MSRPERREFFRLDYKTRVKFQPYRSQGAVHNARAADGSLDGSAKNISQNGVLFQTDQHPPQISSIVWMSMDMRTLKICQEIECRVFVLNNGLLGKVVRVEEDPEKGERYDVGVCFLRKDQQ